MSVEPSLGRAIWGLGRKKIGQKRQVNRLKEHRASGNLSKCPIDGLLQGPEEFQDPYLFPDFCWGSHSCFVSSFELFLEPLENVQMLKHIKAMGSDYETPFRSPSLEEKSDA